ncbi:zinc finger BED domain-containing protein RICESLEEPER 2-like [Brassica rapa]|uniref:zinc finger BED domain-containing protein RICESLEEPER 2-like n=1 Tax=Brassica campestris TaxID=3711 RepID=UPI00142D3FCC|nr:zinc finger BED domain-containing protein RICESLEEPER 2-like [Brassica rapa]
MEKNRGRCIYCCKELVIEVKNGTSSLKRHLEICPVKPQSDGNAERKYDHNVNREMTSELIIYHDLPFRYVKYEKVRARDKYLNPKCVPICRQTAAADVFRKYEMEKAKLKRLFANLKSRVCFTTDLWSARTVMGYICLTANYIDNGWTINNKILAFCEIKPPHTGDEIAKKVLGCLKEWGLENKVFSFTLDNATSNTSMQKILTHRLQMVAGNRLPCNGKFLHVRCCAHILNLIVKEGIELANSLLENIRESVRFVKASQSRKDAFAACVESSGTTGSLGLSLDLSTRWNSTYDMLARALKFRMAFASYKVCDRSYNTLPSEEEWERGQKICDFLKPFSTITTYFSGVKYPTANIYFIQVWNIELLLRKYADCDDEDLRLMARRMQIEFTKYWDDYSIVLAMGAMLDPRFKTQILKKAFDRLDPTTSEKKVKVIVQNLKDLYEEYTSKLVTGSSSSSNYSSTPDDLLNESPLDDDLNADLFELERSIHHGSDNTKTSLELYLEAEA